jgi:CheY-like chemotaxis protein
MIDDEPDIVRITTFRLKKAGYEVLTAIDGKTGHEMAQTTNPDLILLDLNLPLMSGQQVCFSLKSIEKTKKIPVIILSASAENIKEKAEIACGDDFLVKPFDPQELLAKIERLITLNEPEENININQKKTVIIDSELKELIPGFINEKRKNLAMLIEAYNKTDFETVRKIGHMMRGSGGAYGFAKITELGESLEFAARDNKQDVIKQKIDELTDYLNNIEITYTPKL